MLTTSYFHPFSTSNPGAAAALASLSQAASLPTVTLTPPQIPAVSKQAMATAAHDAAAAADAAVSPLLSLDPSATPALALEAAVSAPRLNRDMALAAQPMPNFSSTPGGANGVPLAFWAAGPPRLVPSSSYS